MSFHWCRGCEKLDYCAGPPCSGYKRVWYMVILDRMLAHRQWYRKFCGGEWIQYNCHQMVGPPTGLRWGLQTVVFITGNIWVKDREYWRPARKPANMLKDPDR